MIEDRKTPTERKTDIGESNPQMAAAGARGEAIRQLIDNHREEWDRIHNEARARYGLRPHDVESLRTALNQANKRILELEAQLQ